MRTFIIIIFSLLAFGCSSKKYDRTVTYIERDKFMGDWYVIAGRFTDKERDAHNAIESYTWNKEKERIDISFRFNKGGPTGPEEKYTMKGWIETPDNAHWKVQPFWPIKFDYLMIAIANDYRWTAIGVPDEKYLWIMCRDPYFTKEEVAVVLQQLKKRGYDTSNITYVSHWEKK
ncbi:MAG: lipocalin family protein [Bacteriovoracaceae bacterium]